MQLAHRILCEREFVDDAAVDQVLLDNPFQHDRRAGVVPHRFGIDDRNRSLSADPQAVCFRPIHQWFRSRELQFFEALFQVFPGFETFFFRRAFRFGLIGAKKNVAFIFLQTKSSSYGFQVVSHRAHDALERTGEEAFRQKYGKRDAHHQWRDMKIISGGQTGVDRAALDFAVAHGIAHGGWCPRGRLAEDGRIEERYQLMETPSDDPIQRTEWNVRDSQVTVVFSIAAQLTGGSKKTAELAAK